MDIIFQALWIVNVYGRPMSPKYRSLPQPVKTAAIIDLWSSVDIAPEGGLAGHTSVE